MFLLSVLLSTAIGVGTWVVVGIKSALVAEGTFHAYRLVLDVVGRYCAKYERWPQSWDDLMLIAPEGIYANWSWPADVERIKDHIIIDFTSTIDEVTRSGAKDFEAIQQRTPQYHADDETADLIDSIRKLPGEATVEAQRNVAREDNEDGGGTGGVRNQ